MIAIILAGGLSSRLGGNDKTLLAIRGRPILERIADTLAKQCTTVVLNANGDPARFPPGFTVVPDRGDRVGPLGGILAGLDHVAEHYPGEEFALTVPSDAPFIPHNLVARLQDRRIEDRSDIVCARSGGRLHPVVALWSVHVRSDIRAALDGGITRVRAVLMRHALSVVDWPADPFDVFFNINTPDDLARAEAIAAALA